MPNDSEEGRLIAGKYGRNTEAMASYLVTIAGHKPGLIYWVFQHLNHSLAYDFACRFLAKATFPINSLSILAESKDGLAAANVILWNLKNRQPLFSINQCNVSILDVIRLEQLIANARPIKNEKKAANGINIPFATLKAGENIRLLPFVVEKLTKIAADYHAATGKTLTITDGDRTALEQAFMMIRQIRKGEIGIYSQKNAAAEVKKAYDLGQAIGKSDAQIAQDIEKVIQKQIDKQGIFISRHLRNRGADIRSRDMNPKERNAFNQAAKKHGVEVLKEGDHIHLQF